MGFEEFLRLFPKFNSVSKENQRYPAHIHLFPLSLCHSWYSIVQLANKKTHHSTRLLAQSHSPHHPVSILLLLLLLFLLLLVGPMDGTQSTTTTTTCRNRMCQGRDSSSLVLYHFGTHSVTIYCVRDVPLKLLMLLLLLLLLLHCCGGW